MPGQLRLAVAAVLSACSLASTQQKVMLKVTADAGVFSVRGHFLDSNSTAPSNPIRQNQNWEGFETKALLMAFDVAPIKGWKIAEAYLHLYVAKEDLYGVGACEVLAPWAEQGRGRGRRQAQAGGGGPSWQYAHNPKAGERPDADNWWAWPGSNIASVAWAHPMARYSHAGPGQIQKENVGYPGEGGDYKPFVHLRLPLDPRIVSGMAAGTNYGIVLTDDKGQVAESYSLIGPGYPYAYNESADPWVFTKDIQDESLRPALEVQGGPAGYLEPTPAEPKDLKVVKVEPGTSTVTVELTAPEGQVLAYEVVYTQVGGTEEGFSQAQNLPRWEIPLPARPGTRQRMPIWSLPPGDYTVAVRTVGATGNRSQFVPVKISVPAVPEARLAEVERATEPAAGGEAAQGPRVYAVPDNVKVDPVSGAVLRAGNEYRVTEVYGQRNPVWDAADRRVSLQAAANETVAFQVIIAKGESPLKDVRVQVSDLAGPDGTIAAQPNVQVLRAWYVKSKGQEKRQLGPNEVEDVTVRPVAWHADACVPMAEPFAQAVNVPAEENGIDGQANQAIWVDVYVPGGTKAGPYTGKLTVCGQGLPATELTLALKVLPLALPDVPTWIIELNSYGGLPDLAGVGGREPVKARQASWEFYRLAKAHRQMINVLPYKQSGRVDLPAPKVEIDGNTAKVTDWSAFDEYYAPLLDGSLFAAGKGYVGPGAGTPISEMYLPFHENWPLPLDKWYQDYAKMKTRLDFAAWARKSRLLDAAFSEDYKRMYADVARQMAEHFQQKGWTKTSYQVFLNDKYYFKVPYFASQLTTSGGTGTSFWLLDEPVDFDDYMANAFFLGLPRRGVQAAKAPDVKFSYRTDVSQPEMTRGLWNDVCDLWVCGGGSLRSGYVTTAVVRQKWLPAEEFWHYGGGPNLSAPPVNMAQAFLASWASGSSGMLPWWTTEGGNSWKAPRDADLALFYTGRNVANSGQNHPGPLPGLRMKVARRAQQDIEYLHLLAGRKGWDRARVRQAIGAYAEDPDAPVLQFGKMTAEQQFELRAAVVATILAGQ